MKKDYSRGYTPYTRPNKPTDPPKEKNEMELMDSIMKADHWREAQALDRPGIIDDPITKSNLSHALKDAEKKAKEIIAKINKEKNKK